MTTPPDPAYPGGFPAILRQMEGRRDPLAYGPDEALPPLDVDLAPLKTRCMGALATGLETSTTSFARKYRDLAREFDGMPELLHLHGLLIANLRRRDQPPQTAALFHRLWAEEATYLLDRLDARWLVSAITTFGDHGLTEAQRRVGTALSVLFGMMKLYETERLYSGHTPDQPFEVGKKSAKRLPLDMDAYAISGGGLDVNLLGRLYEDAGTDPVIAPLAQHLLTLLITDPSGLFRRLRRMRAARGKLLEAEGVKPRKAPRTGEVAVTIPPAVVKTDPAAIRWGTVTLTNAPLSRIAGFAAHHLEQGAAEVHLYLDTPDQEAAAFLSQNPRVRVTTCDAAWWGTQKKTRMKAHQLRQSWIATQCYHSVDLDFLAHIDVDEFLLPSEPVANALATLPADQAALWLLPAEQLAHDGPEMFKLTARMAGQDKSVLRTLYPTFADHLRGGFVSHLEGKMIARCGLPGLRIGLHGLVHEGANVTNRQRSDTIRLGHAHAPDWETFKAHLAFRMTRGSYRKTDGGAFKLRDALDYLLEHEGEPALLAFYTEVCTARPDLVAHLDALGMLVRHPLNLTQAISRHFGPLPAGAA